MTTPTGPEPSRRYESLTDLENALAVLTPDEVLALRAFLPPDGTEGTWGHDPEPPRPLGRVLDAEWDPASEPHLARAVAEVTALHSVLWSRHARPYDQRDVFACTGMAIAGLIMSDPVFDGDPRLRAKNAFGLYSAATKVDPYPGEWPPDDTGSDGNSAAKAARALGWIGSWANARTADDLNRLLQRGPAAIGVPWYGSFNEPDRWGTIHLAANADVIGGHEFEVCGWSMENDMYRAANSWGTGWGDNGYFNIPGTIVRRLFTEGADCTQVYQ